MIRNLTRKTVLHKNPALATNFLQKALGLMFRTPKDEAVVFPFLPARREVLHMWFVFGPLEVLLLDTNGEVLATKHLTPWSSWNPSLRIAYIVEVPVGTIKRSRTAVGDRIAVPTTGAPSIWRWWQYALFIGVHLLLSLFIAALIVTILK